MNLFTDGVEIYDAYFQKQLPQLREEFDAAINLVHNDKYRQRIFPEAAPTMCAIGVNPWLISLAGEYIGKPVRVSVFRGKRLLPCAPIEYDAFQWHHDGEGKRIRLMVYLTDVGPDDQCMDYALGSHRQSRPRGASSAFPEAFRVVSCVGRAGTAILFDTNGAHRGNRSLRTTRDSLNYRYAPDTWLQTARDLFKRAMVVKRDWSSKW